MTEYHDRQTMERLHQHLARADRELHDAQHFLAPGSGEEAEMDLVDAVSAARLALGTALETVRSRLGEPGGVNTRTTRLLEPQESPVSPGPRNTLPTPAEALRRPQSGLQTLVRFL